MNVKELKEKLKDLPDSMEIAICKDNEGYNYSPLEEVATHFVTSDGEVYNLYWSANDLDFEEDEWEEIKKSPKTLILFPEE